MARVDGPPEPTIRPVRGLLTSSAAEAGIGDGLVHRDPGIGRAVAHEAPGPAVNRAVEIDLEAAMDLGAEAKPGVILGGDDAGFCGPQAGRDLFGIAADR